MNKISPVHSPSKATFRFTDESTKPFIYLVVTNVKLSNTNNKR